ncbi:hypothetical protein JTB14_017927 [Gonioctena quinquepunctata]|nr:hypothetical protein JTB14_017927 [Gonioctena quinquepunctata]
MTKDESTNMSGPQQSLDDETNQSNEHLHYSIKKFIKEELRLSVDYIIEKISQTDTKIDVLKDSNIDLVSLLTNKDNLIRDISHSCYNKPRILSTIQHTISNEECMMTNNKKNSEAEIELRPTQFFRDNTQHKKTFTEQTRGQCQRPQSSRTNMRSQKTRNYQPRTQYEEKNHHSRNNKQYNVNSKRHYSPQISTKKLTPQKNIPASWTTLLNQNLPQQQVQSQCFRQLLLHIRLIL